MTKICIFGAGAIGAYIGGKIASAKIADVSLIARGSHLQALKTIGLTIQKDGVHSSVHPRATANPRDLGPQDFVIVALKSHTIPDAVDAIRPLLGPETAIVYAVNGIPWWYFYKCEGALQDRRIKAVDPDGKIWNALEPGRAIGCVVYAATEVSAPGIIKHIEGDKFALGEPSGEKTERIKTLSRILIKSGLKAPIRPRIRNEIWFKLWGNCAFNPISVLTHATLEDMCKDPGVRAFARSIMVEAQSVAQALGVTFPIDIEQRIAGAQEIGAHKTSMLQDLERNRSMEIDAIVTAVQELGYIVHVPTPTLDTVLSLTKQRARSAGLYPG